MIDPDSGSQGFDRRLIEDIPGLFAAPTERYFLSPDGPVGLLNTKQG
jgi:hypothetical protein